MAKAKTNSLRDEIMALPDYKRTETWSDKLKDEKPELMAEIDKLIDEWKPRNSPLRAKCPNVRSFSEKIAPLVGVTAATVSHYINARTNGNS